MKTGSIGKGAWQAAKDRRRDDDAAVASEAFFFIAEALHNEEQIEAVDLAVELLTSSGRFVPARRPVNLVLQRRRVTIDLRQGPVTVLRLIIGQMLHHLLLRGTAGKASE